MHLSCCMSRFCYWADRRMMAPLWALLRQARRTTTRTFCFTIIWKTLGAGRKAPAPTRGTRCRVRHESSQRHVKLLRAHRRLLLHQAYRTYVFCGVRATRKESSHGLDRSVLWTTISLWTTRSFGARSTGLILGARPVSPRAANLPEHQEVPR